MEIKNGVKYKSNYARAAAAFLGTCAQRADGGARRAAYDLITGIYAGLMDAPREI